MSPQARAHEDGSMVWRSGTVVVRAGEWGISAEFLDTDTGAWEVVSHTEVVAILSSGDTAGLDAELIALVREAAEALRQGKETA